MATKAKLKIPKGWKLVPKGKRVEVGDKWYDEKNQTWDTAACIGWIAGTPTAIETTYTYIRRLPKAPRRKGAGK